MLTKEELLVEALGYALLNQGSDESWKKRLETVEVEPAAEDLRKDLLAVMNDEFDFSQLV